MLEINSVCNIHITMLQKISVNYGIIQASELIVQSATDIAQKFACRHHYTFIVCIMINSVCNIHITLLQNSSVHYGIIQASELGQVCVAHP